LANHFEKEFEKGKNKMLQNFEVGPKGPWDIYGYLVSIVTRDHSQFFVEFLEV
jgi:hypothetical protein